MPLWYPFCNRRAEFVRANYWNGSLGHYTTIQFLEGFNEKIK